MKTLNSFFAALLTVILIASCSDSPAGNDTNFEQVRYGNFMQVSETRLDWVGNRPAKGSAQTSAQGDSTFYAGPDGNALRVEYFENNSQSFGVTYTDSSYSFAYFDTTVAASEVDFVNPFAGRLDGTSTGLNEDQMNATITISNFSCDSTYNFDQDFQYNILDDQGGIYEKIVVDADGVIAGMRAIGC